MRSLALRLAGLLVPAAMALSAVGCTQERKDVGPQLIVADTLAEKSAAATAVYPGDNIVLRLPATHGTGYAWRTLHKPAYEWNAMILNSNIEASTMPAAGAPAWQVFKLRATKPGIQAIEFVYDRPWEPEAAPAKSFTLNLEVIKRGF